MFLGLVIADRAERPPAVVASSWPVAHHHEGLHPDHLGKSQPLTAATTITGDEYCEAAGITRIDFVKIDVDGYEFPVLQGFQHTLRRCRPKILIEIAPYFYDATQAADFERFIGFLRDLDYDFSDANSGRRVPDTTDGLRLDWINRWVHVRVSQTEPMVRVICEQHGDEPRQLFEETMEIVRSYCS